MPELPEVETVRRTLYGKVVGRRIERVELITPRQVWHPDPDTFRAELEELFFTGIERRGKWLIFLLGPSPEGIGATDGGVATPAGSSAPATRLVAHLRMSGHLFICDPDRPADKHTHVIFHLDDGRQLRYEDQRKFGGFHLLGPRGEGMPPGLAQSGPEPLEGEFTGDYLAGALATRRTSVKAALLDQSVAAGLGNIYVDEALHGARIHPERQAASLSREEVERLHGAIRLVLTRAIERRGTTFSLYFDGDGAAGDFYDDLAVFDRTGEPCRRCGTAILKLAVAGRGTHLCPVCQPAPEGAKLIPRRARPGRRAESVLTAAEPPPRRNTKRGDV
jgi:formamidopyrimidine-DNA glycosylase